MYLFSIFFLLLISCTNIVGNASGIRTQSTPLSATDKLAIEAHKAMADSIIESAFAFRNRAKLRPVHVSVKLRQEYIQDSEAESDSGNPLLDTLLQEMGFIPQQKSASESQGEFQGNNVAGYYISGSDSMVLILNNAQDALTTQNKMTIFHEAIHAMQDQYHDLSTLTADIANFDEAFAYRAAVEGEAHLMESLLAISLREVKDSITMDSLQRFFLSQVETVEQQTQNLYQESQVPIFTSLPTYLSYTQGAWYHTNKMDSIFDFKSIESTYANMPQNTYQILGGEGYSVIQNFTLENSHRNKNYFVYDNWGSFILLSLFYTHTMPNAKAHIANLIADGFWYWKEDEYQFVMAFTLSSDENANNFIDDFKSFVENHHKIKLPPILAGELSSTEHKIHIKNIGNTLLFADGVKSDDVKQIFDSFSTPSVQRIPKFMSKPSKYPLPEILAPYVKHH